MSLQISNRGRCAVFMVGVATLISGPVRSAVAGSEAAEAVLSAYDKTMQMTRMWRMEVTNSTTWNQSFGTPRQGSTPDVMRAVYIRDGIRRDADSTVANGEHKGQPGAHHRVVLNGWFVAYDKSSDGIPSAAMFAATGKKFVAAIGLGGEPPLEGYAADGRITDILRKAKDLRKLDTPETVDGAECVVVTGDCSPDGKYTLWCDPRSDYLPRKIVIEKTGDDILNGRKIGGLKFGGAEHKPVGLTRLTYTVDGMKFQRIGGVVVPTECRMTTRHEYTDGNWHCMVDVCKREKIDLSPDLTGREVFRPDLPNGTRLTNLENPQIPYQWRDGQPEPLVNQSTIRHMDSTADRVRAGR